MSGTWMLDSEALSAYLRADKKLTAKLALAEREDIIVATAAATIIEADHAEVHPARLDWVLSRLDVVSITKDVARSASKLLRAAGLHGHQYAMDSMVVAAALGVPDKPVTILTSDPGDISTLLGDRLNRKGPGHQTDPKSVRVVPV